MDIKLKGDVKPHITADTSFDQLVEIAEKRDAIAHSTGLYGRQNLHTMQYQMQSYLRNPEIPETTTKHHPNDTPITPLSIPACHLKRMKDAKEMELATTVAR